MKLTSLANEVNLLFRANYLSCASRHVHPIMTQPETQSSLNDKTPCRGLLTTAHGRNLGSLMTIS